MPAASSVIAISNLDRKMGMWRQMQAPDGLNGGLVPLLVIVCDAGELTQNELVHRASMEKSVVAKGVAQLVQGGYLTRTVLKTDHRSYLLQPTEKALSIHPCLVSSGETWIQKITAGMTKRERTEFERLLEIASENANRVFGRRV